DPCGLGREAQDRAGELGLAAPALADQRDRLPRLESEAHAVERRPQHAARRELDGQVLDGEERRADRRWTRDGGRSRDAAAYKSLRTAPRSFTRPARSRKFWLNLKTPWTVLIPSSSLRCPDRPCPGRTACPRSRSA